MDDQSSDKSARLEKRLSLLEGQIAPRSGKKTKFSQEKETNSSFGLAFRVASDMIAGILVGVGIGYGLDEWTGHKGLFLVVFALLGFGAGMRNVWRVAAAPVEKEQGEKNGRSPRG